MFRFPKLRPRSRVFDARLFDDSLRPTITPHFTQDMTLLSEGTVRLFENLVLLHDYVSLCSLETLPSHQSRVETMRVEVENLERLLHDIAEQARENYRDICSAWVRRVSENAPNEPEDDSKPMKLNMSSSTAFVPPMKWIKSEEEVDSPPRKRIKREPCL